MSSSPSVSQSLTKRSPYGRHASVSLIVAMALIALFSWACGDDSEQGPSARGTDAGSATSMATENSQPSPTPTLSPEQLEEVLAALRDVPVLSEELVPDWSEEGVPGALLTEVCPSAEERVIFAEMASRPLLGPNQELAGSGDVFFFEQSDARPYTQELFADAAACSQALAEAWLGQNVSFATSGIDEVVGEESFLITALDVPGAAVFFRREEVVAAVVLLGPDSEQLLQELAQSLDQQIIEKLKQFTGGQG